MIIGYARVSTVDQSLDLQTDALTRAGCERIFTETASGAQRDRPELKAALDYMRSGDALIVWKLDRLARTMTQLIATVEDLKARQIGFRSLTEAIDATTPAGMFHFNLFAALAQFERALIRERSLAGLAAARARGRIGGRRRKLNHGDDDEALRALVASSLSRKEIAARLNVSQATLYRRIATLGTATS